MKEITHGPFLGHTTSSSAKIWLRAFTEDENILIFRLYKNGDEIDFREVTILQANDYCATAYFSELQPDSEYTVHIALRKNYEEHFSFHTKKQHSSETRFIFGSCRYNHWNNIIQNDAIAGEKTFVEMANIHQTEPQDFMLFLGGQIYSDPTYSIGVS